MSACPLVPAPIPAPTLKEAISAAALLVCSSLQIKGPVLVRCTMKHAVLVRCTMKHAVLRYVQIMFYFVLLFLLTLPVYLCYPPPLLSSSPSPVLSSPSSLLSSPPLSSLLHLFTFPSLHLPSHNRMHP